MENFRNKITNYKATPNDNAWERMLIKKEKQKILKIKPFLFLLIGLNLLGLSLMSYNYFKKPRTEITNNSIDSTQSKITTIETSNNNLQSETLANYVEQINKLELSNNNLVSQINQLKKDLSQSKIKLNRAQLKNASLNTSILKLQQQSNPTSIITTAKDSDEYKIETFVIEPKSDIARIKYLYSLPINKAQAYKYLLSLREEEMNIHALSLQASIIDNKKIGRWMASIGTSYINDLKERETRLVLGLNRSIHRKFDAGVLFRASRAQDRSEYRNFPDVIDQDNEILGLAYLRYNALNFKKFTLMVDGGLGYRFSNRLSREQKVVENELEYFQRIQKWNHAIYNLGLGVNYQFTQRLGLSLHLYSGYINNTIQLNYKF